MINYAVGLAGVLVLLFAAWNARVLLEASTARVVDALKLRRAAFDPHQFEALVARVNRIEKSYKEWVEDVAVSVADALERGKADRNRVDKTIERALERVAKGGEGLSALEGLAEEFRVTDASGGSAGGVRLMRKGVGGSAARYKFSA